MSSRCSSVTARSSETANDDHPCPIPWFQSVSISDVLVGTANRRGRMIPVRSVPRNPSESALATSRGLGESSERTVAPALPTERNSGADLAKRYLNCGTISPLNPSKRSKTTSEKSKTRKRNQKNHGKRRAKSEETARQSNDGFAPLMNKKPPE